VGGWRNKVYIVDVTSTSPVVKCELKTSAMACIALFFSPDGSILYTGHNNGTLFAWDWDNQTVVHTMEGHSGYCNCIEVSTDGSKLWSGGDDKTVRVWDAKEATQLDMKKMDRGVNCIAACPTQDWVVAGLDNSNLEVFSSSGEDTHKLELDAWRINSVKFANTGSWFATTTEKGLLKGFTTPAGPSIFSVEGKQDTTSSCDIARDDTRIVTGLWGTFGKMARVYDLE
jgi:WD40 repeat protein